MVQYIIIFGQSWTRFTKKIISMLQSRDDKVYADHRYPYQNRFDHWLKKNGNIVSTNKVKCVIKWRAGAG